MSRRRSLLASCATWARSRRALRRELEALRCEVLLDPLTRLLNRDGLHRLRLPACTVLYLDLDGFKAVNDTYGHAAGDETLRMVARVLATIAAAGGGAAARVGGDEFVLVLPMGSDELSVRAAVRTVRRALDVPVSIGAARCESHAQLADAVQRADAAMYEDKRARARPVPRQRGSNM